MLFNQILVITLRLTSWDFPSMLGLGNMSGGLGHHANQPLVCVRNSSSVTYIMSNKTWQGFYLKSNHQNDTC